MLIIVFCLLTYSHTMLPTRVCHTHTHTHNNTCVRYDGARVLAYQSEHMARYRPWVLALVRMRAMCVAFTVQSTTHGMREFWWIYGCACVSRSTHALRLIGHAPILLSPSFDWVERERNDAFFVCQIIERQMIYTCSGCVECFVRVRLCGFWFSIVRSMIFCLLVFLLLRQCVHHTLNSKHYNQSGFIAGIHNAWNVCVCGFYCAFPRDHERIAIHQRKCVYPHPLSLCLTHTSR